MNLPSTSDLNSLSPTHAFQNVELELSPTQALFTQSHVLECIQFSSECAFATISMHSLLDSHILIDMDDFLSPIFSDDKS